MLLSRTIQSPAVRAEGMALGWEVFSAILFSAVVFALVPFPLAVPAIFAASLALSAALARRLFAMGQRGFWIAAGLRIVAWPLALAPIYTPGDHMLFVAAVAFGAMAGGMRRAIYRRVFSPPGSDADRNDVRLSVRERVLESATAAGVVGGHVMMLFSMAFLRTKTEVIFRAWLEVIPLLALFGTLVFTLAVIPATRHVAAALDPGADRAALDRGLRQAERLPTTLAYASFFAWLVCTITGGAVVRPPARASDALMQVGFGAVFSWGISFYQRAWHAETIAPVIARLRQLTGAEDSGTATKPADFTLEQRMMRAFGLPLVFMGALSLFSAIGLYRALAIDSDLRQDLRSIFALFAAFFVLLLATGGLVRRGAQELSLPMRELAARADLVASGELTAVVPRQPGPDEVLRLSESIERMRDRLAQTIAELERERVGLEANVEARTRELQQTLDELKRTQAALIQGERLASIGELLSSVAHEIYNPLSAIQGAAAPLQALSKDVKAAMEAYRAAEKHLPRAEQQHLSALRDSLDLDASLEDLAGISSVIRRAVDRSVVIVGNLRSFSRTSGEPSPADLHAGIEETLALLGPRLQKAGISLVKQLGELPEVVCRIGEVNQVIMNLLVNAIQAVEAQPPKGETPRIIVSTCLETTTVAIGIEDNGPGVAPGLEKRIFDPFFTTKPRGQGTGLGLSISTDIVRRHGGTLSLERPEASQGARFVLRLPIS